MEWISVKERFPEPFTDVLVAQQNCPPAVLAAYYNPDQEYPFIGADGDVTHWMPLPDPPEDAYSKPADSAVLPANDQSEEG